MTARRAASIALVIFSCSHMSLSAQDTRTRAAGLADGRAAAADGSIAPAFIVGLMGGIPIGISGAHYLGPDSKEASATPALAGAGILIGGTVGIHLTSRAPQTSQWELSAPGIDGTALAIARVTSPDFDRGDAVL